MAYVGSQGLMLKALWWADSGIKLTSVLSLQDRSSVCLGELRSHPGHTDVGSHDG